MQLRTTVAGLGSPYVLLANSLNIEHRPVLVVPEQPVYASGEMVSLISLPDTGYSFTCGSGDAGRSSYCQSSFPGQQRPPNTAFETDTMPAS